MIDPLGHLIAILCVWALAQLVKPAWRTTLIAFAGAGYVAAYSPVGALFILLTCVEAAVLVAALSREPKASSWRKYGLYLVLVNLFFVDFHDLVMGFSIEPLAVSFSTIRIFMTAREMLASREAISPKDYQWIFVAAFFLPAIVVGPVFSGLALRDQSRAVTAPGPSLKEHRLLLQGVVLSILVTSWLQPTIDNLRVLGDPYQPVLAVVLFANLFAAFWGQSLIAESSSRFFGFEIPSNFDRPWKASTIREFWSRWHRSMAGFVMQYIYLPLMLRGVNARLATVLSFVFMGLWHDVTLGYLVWGIGHGLLLAFWPASLSKSRIVLWGQRLGTWTAVVALSYFANYSQV